MYLWIKWMFHILNLASVEVYAWNPSLWFYFVLVFPGIGALQIENREGLLSNMQNFLWDLLQNVCSNDVKPENVVFWEGSCIDMHCAYEH